MGLRESSLTRLCHDFVPIRHEMPSWVSIVFSVGSVSPHDTRPFISCRQRLTEKIVERKEDLTARGTHDKATAVESHGGHHLMLLVSKENCVGKAMLALRPNGSQSALPLSNSCVMEG